MPKNLPDHWGGVNFFPNKGRDVFMAEIGSHRTLGQVQPAWLTWLAEPGWGPGVALV
jgi:hypothetical protein